ncbi:MAG TPA: N-acetyl-alpha-D-glucosaminyl L-malate synthase BshA [Candidatus Hydrogenedentes bacterium]|nr:N-acetyl-alpha-D-glucosaminyl L-malate synthase BshA [Candidatus Hydrogenedentota bacterium]HIJ74584.1 N-acetyl-alpha-D-glucosaminyl L-malate synthase BshA [Candidatus Hydrogenedentota bacterium]
MKIGITCHPTAGGSGIVATELGIALAEKGHTIHFVTTEHPFRLPDCRENIFCHCVDLISYPLFRYPLCAFALANRICQVAEEHAIQLWHAHYATPHATCAIMAREMLPPEKRFKIVTTLHGTDITLVGTDPSFFRITKFAMENSDAVTAVSKWLTRETEREFDLTSPVRTIYNFVNEDLLAHARADRAALAPKNEKIVMHISNFRPVKRVTDIVRAFAKIADQVPARLVMVGEGPERLSAAAVVKQLGLSDKVTFLGNYRAIENILPAADLLLQPSEHESFGMVPLEAMACRVPVIATASGGIIEVVEHGVTGYLCEVGDTDCMAAWAIELLTDAERARQMGEQGRERALRLFPKDKIVAQYEALYSELVG